MGEAGAGLHYPDSADEVGRAGDTLRADAMPDKLVTARMVMEFASGRAVVFEVHEPAKAEVRLDRAPYDPVPDPGFFAAEPYLIEVARPAGRITGATLKLRRERGSEIRYLEDVPRAEVHRGHQRLVFDPDMAIWKCAGCGCGLVEGILAHHYDCTEVAVPRPGA